MVSLRVISENIPNDLLNNIIKIKMKTFESEFLYDDVVNEINSLIKLNKVVQSQYNIEEQENFYKYILNTIISLNSIKIYYRNNKLYIITNYYWDNDINNWINIENHTNICIFPNKIICIYKYDDEWY